MEGEGGVEEVGGGYQQGSKEIPGSLDLHRCASGNLVSILARVRGPVAEESAFHFDRQNGSQLFPAAGLSGLA